MNKLILSLALLLFSIILIFTGMAIFFDNTGFLKHNDIDKIDLEHWIYSNGYIQGIKPITLEGNKDNCWLLIHGYTATPKEIEGLGIYINKNYEDYVKIPLLYGHGQIPSKLMPYNMEDWYLQIINEYNLLSRSCKNINVVGSSMGGTLAIRLSEEYKIKNTILINPLLKFRSNLPISVFKMYGGLVYYTEKSKVGSILNETSLKNHVAYLVSPIKPIYDSMEFINIAKEDSSRINNNIIMFVSLKDSVLDIPSEIQFFTNLNTTKNFIFLKNSDHVALMDYDKNQIYSEINNYIVNK